ncbi:hypothetical protein B0H66DRAFT_644835 [Apodospora peruviana]|uniref:Uncharacterized protein n=1 Tax=Apodospora peruviana TaxID=516989 RepID=A0AAE0HS37_9PEZI|nr:hypothetical protein B0H66DRAFT_644835 [Apodospora peruviana]
MDISGTVSIKPATVGGKANGSYTHEAPEYCIFNKIDKVDESRSPEVYGDCFISGWEEDGELNAIISMKVHDKSKIFEIKAGLEAEMSTPTISDKVTADFNMQKNNLSKETEKTISVNWSGGGSIKNPTKDWNIATLKEAAAAFPDLVAVTPQRTYAILTKYTSLADFHETKVEFSPLDYESAGIYTRALLDHYMDYKAMWKDISTGAIRAQGRPQVDAKAFGANPNEPEPKTQTLAITDATQQQTSLETRVLVTQQGNVIKASNALEDHDPDNSPKQI